MTPDARDRLRRLPPIRRARGYRLYTADGRRLLDLWQADGRAILGHRGGDVVGELKRTLDRGVLAPLPSTHDKRLERALGRLFPAASDADGPSVEIAVFGTRERALEAIASVTGRPASGCRPLEPGGLRGSDHPDSPVALWRPYTTTRAAVPGGWRRTESDATGFVIPVLPTGGLVEAEIVLGAPGSGIAGRGEVAPAPVLALLARAADALVSSPERPVLLLRGFSSVGPYLLPQPTAEYDRLFDAFLEAGIVLNPRAGSPSIVPGELSDGERAALTRAAHRLEEMIGS